LQERTEVLMNEGTVDIENGLIEIAQDEAASDKSSAMLAYEARRCHVCGVRHPAFGFGPPLTRRGQELWACVAHRDEVHRLLRGEQRGSTQPDRQKFLF